jgi:NB-ARC domain
MRLKLKNVLGDINKIIAEMKNFSFAPITATQPIIDRPPTYSYVIESEIVGREGEKHKIINTLLDSNRETKNVSVLPIVGMGGAGKTTVAQLVYNNEAVKKHFNLRMWVCVSNNFDIVNIIKSMIEVAKNEQGETTSNLEVLQKELRNILVGKKYLLVLDDVWNEETQKWDALKTLLFSGVSFGSAILVTTRSKRVASIMGTIPNHDLVILSEEDSWELFRKRAIGDGEVPQKLVKFGKKIIDKCAGLPLALKVIGGLMRTKREVDEWRAISENQNWHGETSNDEILPALKLSYDLLPSHMKHCFAFCAIFSEDEEIVKETLIQLWKANDLIPNYEIMHHEDEGEYIFHQLCWRSFFQDIKEKKNKYEHGKIKITCKMHDLMRELAKNVSGKQCASMLEVENDQVVHMSVKIGKPNNLNSIPKNFPIIRTCLIHREFENKSDNEKHFNLTKSISLRALKVMNNNQLLKELRYMKHLRYLDLSRGNFDSLPETISTLYNLQTLDLSNNWNLSKLPEDMRYMISLENLKFDGCNNLKKLPIYLGKLKSLRVLTKYIVDRDPGHSIKELRNLDLRGRLILTGLENVRDRNEAEETNMVSKTKLNYLKLMWDSKNNEETTRNDDEVLDGLKPYSDLKHLDISCYAGFEFTLWMKDIRNLRTLSLYDCINCTKLPPLWQLPLLEILGLSKMRSLTYICNTESIKAHDSEYLTIFPNLKELEISDLDNLEGWHEQDHKSVKFPMLKHLHISKCSKLKSIPFTPSLRKFDISNAGRIKLLQISNMIMGASSELYIKLDPSPSEVDTFRPPKNVITMKVEGLENVIPLEEVYEENYQKVTLRDLVIDNSNCFFSCGTSKLSLGFWKYFEFLEKLEISMCDALFVWPEQEFRCLKYLRYLKISRCDNFANSSQGSILTKTYAEEQPRLEKFIISECPKLMKIPNCSKSLKVLIIDGCRSLSKEGLNFLKNLSELNRLSVRSLDNLESLPDGLEHLTSLKELIIWECPRLESFPEGLQQRLSALQYLEILGCPILEGRCKNEGDYQHLVADIPRKKIISVYGYINLTKFENN